MKWTKLIEKTIGAVRQVMNKHGEKGYFPVGFSIVMYNPKAKHGERWYYDVRNVIDIHNPPDLHSKKIRERVNLVNEFLSEACKRILEGELDDMGVEKSECRGFWYQIPGVRGRG